MDIQSKIKALEEVRDYLNAFSGVTCPTQTCHECIINELCDDIPRYRCLVNKEMAEYMLIWKRENDDK